MPKPDYSWRAEVREANAVGRSVGWRLLIWVLVILAVIAVIGGIWWGVKVATSDVKGAGDATRKVNSADNRIAAQEHFHTLFNQIKAYDQQLDQAAADKAAHPGDDFWATNYTGLVKTCIDAQNQYNADALKITKAKWLDPELPYEIDTANPATDCKENS